MSFYDNALEFHKAAEILYDHEQYRMSAANSYLAIELYLKSKLHLTEKGENFAYSHDTVNMYVQLVNRFGLNDEVLQIIKIRRKYFNETRYPYGDTAIYTKDFAEELLEFVRIVKNYIDDVCVGNIADLQNKFKK